MGLAANHSREGLTAGLSEQEGFVLHLLLEKAGFPQALFV